MGGCDAIGFLAWLIHLALGTATISSPQLREEMAMDMLKGFGGTSRGDDVTYIDLLKALPTPSKRLEAIRLSNMNYFMERVSDEKLAEFDITREQIKQLKNE